MQKLTILLLVALLATALVYQLPHSERILGCRFSHFHCLLHVSPEALTDRRDPRTSTQPFALHSPPAA